MLLRMGDLSTLGFEPDQPTTDADTRRRPRWLVPLLVTLVIALVVGFVVVGSMLLLQQRQKERIATAKVAMEQLALGIKNGEVREVVNNSTEANADLATMFKVSKDFPHTVSLGDTQVTKLTATNTLTHTWDLGNDTYSYSVPLTMTWSKGSWSADWDRASALPPQAPAGSALLIERRDPQPVKVFGQNNQQLNVAETEGLSGLARKSREAAAGATVVAFVDQSGKDLVMVRPESGQTLNSLQVSLDATLQEKAERLLTKHPQGAALVAIRASDGHILASASNGGPRAYIANLGRFAPGSTFKTVTALAAFRHGYTPTSTVDCPATTTVAGKEFKNYSAYPASATGSITLKTAFAHSCNTAFVGLAQSLPPATLAQAAQDLGMTIDPETGVASTMGAVPTNARGTEFAASLIGQGTVVASPLAMATVAASVAGGHTVKPVFVVNDSSPQPISGKLTPSERSGLHTMMQHTVTSGTGDALQNLPGAGAKTGTAQTADGHENAWMIAYHQDIAVAVLVLNGGSGAKTAGPIARQFLTGL